MLTFTAIMAGLMAYGGAKRASGWRPEEMDDEKLKMVGGLRFIIWSVICVAMLQRAFW